MQRKLHTTSSLLFQLIMMICYTQHGSKSGFCVGNLQTDLSPVIDALALRHLLQTLQVTLSAVFQKQAQSQSEHTHQSRLRNVPVIIQRGPKLKVSGIGSLDWLEENEVKSNIYPTMLTHNIPSRLAVCHRNFIPIPASKSLHLTSKCCDRLILATLH